ncbi:hypothetical protein [Saccharopolyspora sp. NPDC002686]|uniref:Uncharacterized protein n=1 Tax=Saccharopolyspora oryzae TaxID=2997343 RepID=A0ABT4UU64_9PSEU|nr:hypothetical protein [Saccharopolyspora oryzae]
MILLLHNAIGLTVATGLAAAVGRQGEPVSQGGRREPKIRGDV